MTAAVSYQPRLKSHYNDVVRAELIKQLGVQNVMQVPTFEKIVINMGVGRAGQTGAGEAQPGFGRDCRFELHERASVTAQYRQRRTQT